MHAAAARLTKDGIDKVRVELLAKDLGVSKGSFYWHFQDRAALLTAVLAAWEQDATLAIIDEIEAGGGDSPARLRRLMHRVFRTPVQVDLLESALRAWATHDPQAQRVVKRVDRQRIDYVKRLLVDTGIEPREAKRRADLLYRALIGEFIVRSYGGQGLAAKTLEALHALLVSGD